jgi:CHAT domain-containing protein
MRKSQLKALSTEQLVEEFRELSAEHGHALEASNARAANRKYDILVTTRHELRSRGPEAQRQLLKLLADPEPSTRYFTASSLLQFAPSEAEQVLEELVRHRSS